MEKKASQIPIETETETEAKPERLHGAPDRHYYYKQINRDRETGRNRYISKYSPGEPP